MRGRLSTILRLVVAVGLTCLIFWRSHPGAIGHSLSGANWRWILGACLLVIADRALMAVRWLALLAPLRTRRPPIVTIMRVFFVATFVGTFLPAGVGADAARTWMLSREGLTVSEVLASVLVDRLLGVVAIPVGAAVGLALVPGALANLAVTASLAAVIAGSVVALAVIFSVRVDDLLRRTLGRWPVGLRGKVVRVLDALQAFRSERRRLFWVFLASLAVQVLRVLQAWMLGESLGIHVPFIMYFAFVPVIVLAMQLPITFNGIGTSQFMFQWCFGQTGVAGAPAFALSILFVSLGIVGNLPGGLLYATANSRRPRVRPEHAAE